MGTATVSADLDGFKLVAPSAGSTDNIRVQIRTLSPTSNYTFTAYVETHAAPANFFSSSGILLRNSTSGGIITFGTGWGTNSSSTGSYLRIIKYTSASTYNSDYYVISQSSLSGPVNWLRIRDDGTNRNFEFSYNGVDWITLYSIGRTDYITPDQVGWGVGPYNMQVITRLRSWSVV
jgi:hypothetical protein